MWKFSPTKILYVSDGANIFDWQPQCVHKWKANRNIVSIPRVDIMWQGYDSWVVNYPPHDEVDLIQQAIQKAENDPKYFVHIRGISLAESINLLSSYYEKIGLRDEELKNFHLPKDVQVTASISLRHALWCQKDKKFLNSLDREDVPYGKTCPPIRDSHDLRTIQQALRMNCLMGIETNAGDEKHIQELLDREILSPFLVAQMIRFRWVYFAI